MSIPRAAYIHVPFCRHRCGYCDFTLIAGRDDLVPAYLRYLEQELRFHPTDPATGTTPVETLFFGGGTPTHPSISELDQLLTMISRRFERRADAEVTMEANPLDLSEDKLQVLVEHGINRISLGVQSFSDPLLKQLERDHSAADLHSLLPRVRAAIPNLSLDLIFGVPGQTLTDWESSLQQAIQSGATHISTYGLTFESGTAFETRRRRGQLHPTPDELERDMYALAMDVLGAAGFEHYEISNFARPGHACRHNQIYWYGEEFWAYGPGAARYLRRQRETNIRSVIGWMARLERGLSPVAETDPLDDATRARELLFLGLRQIAGIDIPRFESETGYQLLDFVGEAVRTNQERGWLELVEGSLRLTREGRFVADRVITDFLA